MSDNILDFEMPILGESPSSKTPPGQTAKRFLDIAIEDGQPNDEEEKDILRKFSLSFRRRSSLQVATPLTIPLDTETKLAVQTMIANDLKRHRYEIDFNQLISLGHYGSVYKVTRGPEKRARAVKVISMMLTCVEKNFQVKNKLLVRSFRRERSMLGLIGTHANIVSMLEYFTERDEVPPKQPPDSVQKANVKPWITVSNYYFIMEYANRGTLTQLVNSYQPDFLTEPEVKFLALDLIRAVSHLHKLGVFHLDIKPENTLLFEGGFGKLNLTLKLTDFGQAHTEPTLMDALGSYVTMAPEVLRNRWLSHSNLGEFREIYECAKADAWSVGATIYFALHARYPCDNFEYSQLSSVFRTHCLTNPDENFYLVHLNELMGKPRVQLTRQCVQLLNSLLEVDSTQREIITDTTLNEWFNQEANPSILDSFLQLFGCFC